MSKELINITGEFRADATCNADTPRGRLYPDSVATRAGYDFGHAFNVAREGFVVHTLTCAAKPTHTDPFPGGDIVVTIPLRPGHTLKPQRFEVAESGYRDTTETQLAIGILHPAYALGTPGSGMGGDGGKIWLNGMSGWFEITRVDSGRVSARFSISAKRTWSM